MAVLVIVSGCVSVRDGRSDWDDLSAPCEWRELGTEPVKVVAGGKALPIVTDMKPENRWAATFLARTIDEMTGVRPGVMVLAKGQKCLVKDAMFVGGEEEWGNAGAWNREDLGKEGFRVMAKDGCVRFLGRADFGVFDWCERELGMRFYGPDGKCVEKRDEIVARAVEYADRPVFECRLFTGGNDEPWVRVAKAGSAHRGGVAVHQPSGWVRDAKLKAERPEIFENGVTPMLCYGKPETLEYYRQRIDRHIAGLQDSGGIVDTNRKVVTVSAWDAPIACRCRWCRTLYDYAGPNRGFASPVVWGRFSAKLAAWLKTAHPDYEISILPYLNAVSVPGSLGGLECIGNVEAEVCTMPGLALLKNRACKEREEKILREWAVVTGRKVLNWHYLCWPLEWTSAPYVFGRTVRRHYAEMRDVTCGSLVCGSPTEPRTALSSYVWMKCLWNPDVDVEAIYDGYARRMFGAGGAARRMRELIALQEAGWERQWEGDGCTYRNVFEISYPREDVVRMKEFVREAYGLALAADDKTAARRVKSYAATLERFFAESDAVAGRSGRKTIALGTTNELVAAWSVWRPQPWAKTRVTTSVEDGGVLKFVVRCEEPAIAKLGFGKRVDDFIWGNDCVTVLVEGHPPEKVYLEDAARDAAGWTAVVRVRLTDAERAAGMVLGNVSRHRVGDRNLPKDRRVAGSRRERSRLETCYTDPDDDKSAFVEFRLR